jgi:hypothetical protein
MRIALPAGIWDVRIIQSGQTTLAPEPLAAGEPNAALVLP